MRHPWRSLTLAGLLALLVALVLFAPPALAAPPEEDAKPQPATGYACDGGEGVYLYEDIDYGGACIRYTADDPEFGDVDGFHDRATSIKFVGFMYAGGRARATLYEHAYYGGAFTQFAADDPWLGDTAVGNDSADSIRIEIRPFCDMVTQIPKTECEALVALYTTTWGAYWYNHTGWLANYTPCSWYGVTCSGGHVTKLELNANNLTGGIPTSLGNLSSLGELKLGSNQLAGSIPTSLGDLSNLIILFLNDNGLTGSIPESLGNLSNLQTLWLFDNALTSSIPATLGYLSSLRYLNLRENGLTGSIPASLGNLSNLQEISLEYNNLSGGLPSSLGDLANLDRLFLHNNPLSGALPQSLKNLSLLNFSFDQTDLCEPPDAAFQTWLASIQYLTRTNVKCAVASPTPTPTRTSTRTPTRTPTRAAPKRAFLPIIMKQRVATGSTSTPTRTQTATRTPTRTPTPGALIFADDFNDGNLVGWTANGGTWTNPGTYMRGVHSAAAWNMHSASGSNTIYEGTVNILSGSTAGLTFRASANGSTGYDLVLDMSANKLMLRRQPGDEEQVGVIFGSALQYNHQYTLKVVANGSTLDGYLDGIKRLVATDSTYTTGRFGVIVDNATAAWDNLRAWTIP